ncbi:MAG: YbaB/EbfC family nucleoid-associated protein [Pseudomonadota bacterium]|nr:YbaB/EbfC family nucleoid-associated protein [Pseudomonadota bacterium]
MKNLSLQRLKRALLPALLCSSMLAAPAMADPDAATLKQLQAMQAQIEQLQAQLKDMQKKVAAADTAAKTATADAASAKAAAEKAPVQTASSNSSGNKGEIKVGDKVTITPGGFIETAGIYRTRNETADVGSNFNTSMPYPISHSYHMPEFRGSARQSRLSLLAEGKPDANMSLAAYFESDFLGAAPTANSNESNSYNPRLRQAYATLDRSDWGMHILAGQSWSLVTLDKQGITPRKENIPLTIDAQYVPGFNWTRNPQVRFVEDFYDQKLWAGLSFESPQALPSCNSSVSTFCGTTTPTLTFNNTGGSLFAPTSTYSTDFAPDIVAKLAADPGYGHYEVYGLGRFFRDRNNTTMSNNTAMGGGIGAGAILPVISKRLDFQISGLAGKGIGRYGSAQLPDITFKPNGDIAPISSFDLLAGLIGHPDEQWDLYFYGGTERVSRTSYTVGANTYGYGNPLFHNDTCSIEGGSSTSCVANTSDISQLTAGAWWKFYKGSYGMMETGLQDSYTKRNIFRGIGGSPSTNENITMVSFRYYPF